MTTEQGKKKFKFPTAFTILVLITFVVAILTRVIPAGQYDYDENGSPRPGNVSPGRGESPVLARRDCSPHQRYVRRAG